MPLYTRSPYMSSAKITKSWSTAQLAIAVISSLVKTSPLGLFGVFKTSSLVCGV